MKQRCTNPKSVDFPRYGGRGITVCERWLHSFDAFLSDMGVRPAGTTIERIDNHGNYEPGNCRWAAARDQQRNKRNTRMFAYQGNKQTIYDLAAQSGLPPKIIGDRLYAGWPLEKAISTPVRSKRHS